jgi:hypothetical protein
LTYHIVHFLIHYNKKLNRRMLEIWTKGCSFLEC